MRHSQGKRDLPPLVAADPDLKKMAQAVNETVVGGEVLEVEKVGGHSAMLLVELVDSWQNRLIGFDCQSGEILDVPVYAVKQLGGLLNRLGHFCCHTSIYE